MKTCWPLQVVYMHARSCSVCTLPRYPDRRDEAECRGLVEKISASRKGCSFATPQSLQHTSMQPTPQNNVLGYTYLLCYSCNTIVKSLLCVIDTASGKECSPSQPRTSISGRHQITVNSCQAYSPVFPRHANPDLCCTALHPQSPDIKSTWAAATGSIHRKV